MALSEHLDVSFLEEFPVFAPIRGGEHGNTKSQNCSRAVLYCFSPDIYRSKAVARELHDELIWRQCGFESTLSYQSIHRFFTDFARIAEDAFGKLVEQVAGGDLFDNTFRIDSTVERAMPADPDVSKCYNSTTEEYYYGYCCTIVSTGQSSPLPPISPKATKPQRRRRARHIVIKVKME